MEMKNQPEKWISLPDLPIPTVGFLDYLASIYGMKNISLQSGPGVGMIDGEIHVIGGFDIIATESITHGEYYYLTWPIDNQWKERKSLEPVRARSLVLLIPNTNENSIYVAGGYDVSIDRHVFVVSNIYACLYLISKTDFLNSISSRQIINKRIIGNSSAKFLI